MLTLSELRPLLARQSNGEFILSIYLNIDQARSTNINRKFEASMKTLLKDLRAIVPEEKKQELQEAVAPLSLLSGRIHSAWQYRGTSGPAYVV